MRNRAKSLLLLAVVGVGLYVASIYEHLIDNKTNSSNQLTDAEAEISTQNEVVAIPEVVVELINSEVVTTHEPFQITIPKEKQEVISEIVTSLGRHTILGLGIRRSKLENMGKQLKNLGPLQFLAYIFSNPSTKKNMHLVRRNSFKWGAFVRGMSPKLQRELDNGHLENEINGFASFLGIEPVLLQREMTSGEWEKFLQILLDQTNPHVLIPSNGISNLTPCE